MTKPAGIALDLQSGFRVTQSSATEDRIWDAVRDAIAAGWTPRQFRNEAASAWDYELDERRKHAAKEWKDD